MDNEKKSKNIKDRLTFAYIRKIKKWMFCPACKKGKMSINKKSAVWICEDCGYKLSADEFEDGYTFWFCDGCGAYLNNQNGFDKNAGKHICTECGYENDITADNIKGECKVCGKLLPDPDATLCTDCRIIRRKERLLKIGKATLAIAATAGAVLLAIQSSKNENTNYLTDEIEDNDDDDDIDYDYYDDDDDYDDSESLSADDAALIWASNGKDEDYTFGYTEYELEKHL